MVITYRSKKFEYPFFFTVKIHGPPGWGGKKCPFFLPNYSIDNSALNIPVKFTKSPGFTLSHSVPLKKNIII